MSIIDNTLAAQVPTFDPATPLAQAAKIQAANQEIQQAQFKQNQLELGSEMRGLQPFVNTADFPNKWREAADRLRAKGVINDQMYGQWANAPSPLLLKSIISQTDSPEMAFRKDEAVRAQGNSNREFGLAQRRLAIAERAANETLSDKVDERSGALSKVGIDPNSPQGKAYLLTGKVAEAETSLADTVNQRKAAAVANGLDPASPGYQSYILTGKMPREDAQPLSATDKKAILEADEKVQSGKQTIENLEKAKFLSKDSFEGPTAKYRGYVASFLPSGMGGDTGVATQDLENLITTNALSQLKTIFGGNPTEGERGILLDIQGSVGKSDAVRQKIFDRAIEAAKKRVEFEQQRADELRGGSFYKNQGGTSKASTQGKPDPDTLRKQAKEAIDAGAPREEVIKRLKQQGVSADGL